jgi:hypothetical protein
MSFPSAVVATLHLDQTNISCSCGDAGEVASVKDLPTWGKLHHTARHEGRFSFYKLDTVRPGMVWKMTIYGEATQ